MKTTKESRQSCREHATKAQTGDGFDLSARYIVDLLDDLDEALANYAACAHAVGVEYEADGHASEPGPVADVVRHIEEAVRGNADRLEAAEKRAADAESAHGKSYLRACVERDSANARAERLRAALQEIADQPLWDCEHERVGNGEAVNIARLALAQSVDAPEVSAKTSGSDAKELLGSCGQNQPPSYPAEAPKSRDYECIYCGARFPKQPRCPRCGEPKGNTP